MAPTKALAKAITTTMSPAVAKSLSAYLTTPLMTARFVLTLWTAIMITVVALILLHECVRKLRRRRRESRHHSCECKQCKDAEQPLLLINQAQRRAL
jgi:uncharacterized protein (DUF2062 family)